MSLTDLLKKTRLYFWNQDFDEVEVPYLNSSLPLEPNLYSFKTNWAHSHEDFYLPTSPEFALKSYLAATQKNCFAISHCFRDLEAEGPHHTKEFLMLEWYEVGKTYLDLMDSVKKYVSQFVNINFSELKLPADLPNNEPDFNQFFLNKIEPNLASGGVFITGYPAFLSPLAKVDADNVFFDDIEPASQTRRRQKKSLPSQITSERFELYINRIEIANDCTENRDPISIKNAFEQEKSYRLKKNLPLHPYSEKFIADCAALPPCAGVGLGLDRLLMLIS